MNQGFAYHDPMNDTPEGQLLGIVNELERIVKSKNSSMAYMDKNMNCMGCKSDEGETCEECSPNTDTKKSANYGYKSDRGDKKMPNLPSPKGNKNMAGKSKKGKKPLVGGQKELDKDKDGDIDGDDFKQMRKADMSEKLSIVLAVGTRPEAIKLAPLYLALKKLSKLRPVLLSTGQHREMLDQVLQIFEIRPDIDLNLMRPGQNLHDLTARILMGLRPVLETERPDVVLVHGDTTTTLAATLNQ